MKNSGKFVSCKDVINWIQYLESKYPVGTWEYCGVPVWPSLRIRITSELMGSSRKQNSKIRLGFRTGKLTTLLAEYVKSLKSDWKDTANAATLQPADILFFGNSACRESLGGKYYDRLCYPIMNELDKVQKTHLMLEYSAGGVSRTPRAHKSHYIRSKIFFHRALSDILFAARKLFSRRSSFSEYQDFAKEVSSYRSWFRCPTPAQAEKYAFRIAFLSRMFERILLRVVPKGVFLVCFYNESMMALSLAANRLGIPQIDIQHGLAGDTHRCYAKWNNLPESGYSVFPRLFWSWTEKDGSDLRKWVPRIHGKSPVIVGGNPWHSYLRSVTELPCVADWRHQVEEIINRHPSRIHILLSIQPTIGLSELFVEFMQESRDKAHWWIRTHPLQDKSELKAELSSFDPSLYTLELASNAPLPLILEKMDLHVTGYSSVALEATLMQVPTLYTSEHGRHMLAHIASEGMVCFVQSAKEFTSVLRRRDEPNASRGLSHSESSLPAAVREALKLIERDFSYKEME